MVINPYCPRTLARLRVPCSVEDCPRFCKAGWYQVHGITDLGNSAMRVVLFLCPEHARAYEKL